jgi:hypothetical protein
MSPFARNELSKFADFRNLLSVFRGVLKFVDRHKKYHANAQFSLTRNSL